MDIEHGFKIDTSWSEDQITQCVNSVHDGVTTELYRNVVDLQDQGIRDALIAMGWTPPKD